MPFILVIQILIIQSEMRRNQKTPDQKAWWAFRIHTRLAHVREVMVECESLSYYKKERADDTRMKSLLISFGTSCTLAQSKALSGGSFVPSKYHLIFLWHAS